MMPRYKHQERTNELLQQFPFFALIMEQGTGKSRPILDDWIRRNLDSWPVDLVVLAPKGCYMNWIGTPQEPGEIDKWVSTEMRDQIYVAAWRSGASQAQQRELNNLLHARGPRFLAMNIEALNRKGPARIYLENFIRNHRVIGVIDESTTICHEEAARTEYLLDIANQFYARRILSGLVAPESPLDLYTQYHYLDWRIIGQKSFYGFKNRYAIMEQMDFRKAAERAFAEAYPDRAPKYRKPQVVVGFRNLEELNAKIMKYSYRVLKENVLDLPPKIYQFWDVDMPMEQIVIYGEMRDMAYARLGSNPEEYTTASQKLDQLGKLQHILCGHVRNEMGELRDIPEMRTDAVVEILHNHSGKAIIWAPYPRALQKIVTRLRKEFGEDSTVGFWGQHSLDERLEARARIQNDDLCRFIVSNQSVGKFGNTWTACNLVIYYANSFDNEDRQQSEDRPHRIGQTKSVTYIDLRCRGTLDERLIQVLRKKINMSSMLQGDEFRKWLI